MDRRPDVATKVANELMTLFLNEDARNRTNRAMETTRFLAREAQRLEAELAAIEAKDCRGYKAVPQLTRSGDGRRSQQSSRWLPLRPSLRKSLQFIGLRIRS